MGWLRTVTPAIRKWRGFFLTPVSAAEEELWWDMLNRIYKVKENNSSF